MSTAKYGHRYTAAERQRAVLDYQAGVRAGTIAARLGCSTTIVVRWVAAAGLPAHRCAPPVRVLPGVEVLWQEYRRLGSWQRVANWYGVSLTTVLNRKSAQVVAP